MYVLVGIDTKICKINKFFVGPLLGLFCNSAYNIKCLLETNIGLWKELDVLFCAII